MASLEVNEFMSILFIIYGLEINCIKCSFSICVGEAIVHRELYIVSKWELTIFFLVQVAAGHNYIWDEVIKHSYLDKEPIQISVDIITRYLRISIGIAL